MEKIIKLKQYFQQKYPGYEIFLSSDRFDSVEEIEGEIIPFQIYPATRENEKARVGFRCPLFITVGDRKIEVTNLQKAKKECEDILEFYTSKQNYNLEIQFPEVQLFYLKAKDELERLQTDLLNLFLGF